ncbi:MAG: Hpt domain-containing protein [Pseudomonadota bacterium]
MTNLRENVRRLAPPVREPRIDLDVLAELAEELGPRAGAEALEQRLIAATERMVAIERALETEDWTRAARAARELAEVAGSIGLTPVATQAEALRRCCERLDRIAAHAVGQRLLRTGEAGLSCALAQGAV